MDEQEDLAKDMLEQVRKIKVRCNLLLGPSLPFLKWMYVLALLIFLQIRTWPFFSFISLFYLPFLSRRARNQAV